MSTLIKILKQHSQPGEDNQDQTEIKTKSDTCTLQFLHGQTKSL